MDGAKADVQASQVEVEMTDFSQTSAPSTTLRGSVEKLLLQQKQQIATEELQLVHDALKADLDPQAESSSAVATAWAAIQRKKERFAELVKKVQGYDQSIFLDPFQMMQDGGAHAHGEHEHGGKRDWAMLLVGASQVVMIVLYYIFGTYEAPAAADVSYLMYLGIAFMMYFGFGYLMTFLRRTGYSALGFTMLLTAFIMEWSILNMWFWECVHAGHWANVPLSMRWLIEGMFASGTFLISMGALIGKVDLIQLFFIAFWEVVFYAINFFIVGLEFKTMDAGGSMVIHTFGGLFGLAVSWVMAPPSKQPSEDNRSRYGSDITSFIGTVFLMLFWPSFNAFPTGNRQNRAIINTVFSLASSTIATFVVSKLFRPHRKFDMIDICNATLAGGVAVGSTCDFMIGPGGAMVIGTVAGSMSTLMFVYCQPFLERTIKLNDTCGIQALHAAPGMLGGLASIFAALRAADNQGLYDGQFSATFPRGTSQARYQTAALFVTIGISLFSGLLVGFVTKFVTKKRTVSEEMRYRDDLEWETPVGEYALIPQMEELEKLMAARKVE